MVEIIWSGPALRDLEQILTHIAKDSPYYASKTVDEIIGITTTLKYFPKSGRIVPEYRNTRMREIFYKAYRVIYEILPQQVQIVTIIHGSRLLPH